MSICKTLIFCTIYLGESPRQFGYKEEGEDSLAQRLLPWTRHHLYLFPEANIRAFHDGAYKPTDLLMTHFKDYPWIEWGSGERIGRITANNCAGLRLGFARGLRWGLERGYERFAYIESDCYVIPRNSERIRRLLTGIDLRRHQVITDIDPTNPTALMLIGQEAACHYVDQFSRATEIFSESWFEDQVFHHIPSHLVLRELRGFKVEGRDIAEAPDDAEFISQVNRLSRVAEFIPLLSSPSGSGK